MTKTLIGASVKVAICKDCATLKLANVSCAACGCTENAPGSERAGKR